MEVLKAELLKWPARDITTFVSALPLGKTWVWASFSLEKTLKALRQIFYLVRGHRELLMLSTRVLAILSLYYSFASDTFAKAFESLNKIIRRAYLVRKMRGSRAGSQAARGGGGGTAFLQTLSVVALWQNRFLITSNNTHLSHYQLQHTHITLVEGKLLPLLRSTRREFCSLQIAERKSHCTRSRRLEGRARDEQQLQQRYSAGAAWYHARACRHTDHDNTQLFHSLYVSPPRLTVKSRLAVLPVRLRCCARDKTDDTFNLTRAPGVQRRSSANDSLRQIHYKQLYAKIHTLERALFFLIWKSHGNIQVSAVAVG